MGRQLLTEPCHILGAPVHLIQQIQRSAMEHMEKTGSTNRMQIYEAAIMKQYQISYTTFIRYVKETNVQEQIAEYSQLRPDNV